jgi:Protein of unknown function (DUF3450)
MMDRQRISLRCAGYAAGLFALSVLYGGVVLGQAEKVNAAINEQTRAEEAAQASQKRVTELDSEAGKMLSEYRQVLAETQSLRTYNEQLGTQVQSQRTEVETMTRQLGEIETTSREVAPMMQKMLTTLEQFIALDIPFLPEERANRLAQLKDMINRADVSISEKYRRIVEAYQIEMEYGRTIEAYQGKVDDKTVEFVRAGRVSLMYQTLDGRETGYWDSTQKTWVADRSYSSGIAEAMKVAKKQAAPDFITVALPAPQEIAQ